MQVIIALIASIASGALAMPSANANPAVARRDECDAAACAFALGSAGFECSAAAVQEGLDPISDAACLSAAAGIPVCGPCIH